MAFAYTSALQNRIALAVWGVQNSSLNATQKVQLDLTWTSNALAGGAAYDAYIEVSQLAQYFEQAASTPDLSFPEPAWDRLFVACAGMLLNKTVRPDNYPRFKADYETALDQTIDTYTRVLISTTSLDGQGIDLAGIRAFVVDHCVKRANSATGLRRRLFPSIAQIGARDELLVRPLGSAVTALAWSGDGRHLAVGSVDGTAALQHVFSPPVLELRSKARWVRVEGIRLADEPLPRRPHRLPPELLDQGRKALPDLTVWWLAEDLPILPGLGRPSGIHAMRSIGILISGYGRWEMGSFRLGYGLGFPQRTLR